MAGRKTDGKTARKSPRKEKLPLIAYTDGGNCVNLDEAFTWTQGLTDGQRLFVFHYVSQSSVMRNAAEAARKAGYAKTRAKQQGTDFLKSPQILKEIDNIQGQYLKNVTFCDLKTVVCDIIRRKEARMNIKPADFYDIETRKTEEGLEYTSARIKTPDKLTEEQLELVEDVEFVGQRGTPHYRLSSRVQAENELLKIYKDFVDGEGQGDGYEVETTAEIIKGNLQMKTKVMKANREITGLSELSDKTADRAEED